MQAFTQLTGLVVPLDRANIDTDAILPKQYLKSISRTGFGPYLFDEMRYLTPGDLLTDVSTREKAMDFPLNQQRYEGAAILLARENFGCGSSREHAVWALADYGIRAILAPNFADIFYGNCLKRGLLPVVLPKDVIDRLFNDVGVQQGYRIAIDLHTQQVRMPTGETHAFEIGALHKHNLLNGLDDIGATLGDEALIRSYELQRKAQEPWLF